MKNVYICSFDELSALLTEGRVNLKKSFALISLSKPLETHSKVSIMNHVICTFEDLEFEHLGEIFSPEAADGFAEEIKKRTTIEDWYFVSDTGNHRASSVCAAALRYWGYEELELEIWRSQLWKPNIIVYLLLTRVLGVYDPIDLELRIHMNRGGC